MSETPTAPSTTQGGEPPPPVPLSVRRNIVYAVAGTGILNVGRFGVILLLAKFATAEILGRYQHAMALTGPIILFLTLQLRSALVSDAANEFTFGTYRTVRTLSVATAGIVFLGITVWELIAGSNTAFVLILAGVCLAKVAWALSELCWGVFQKRERLDLAAWSNVLRGIAVVAPFAVLLPIAYWSGDDPAAQPERLARATAWAVLLGAAGWLLVFLFFDHPRTTRGADLDHSWRWADVRRLVAQTFPLGLVILLITLCDSVPQLVIEAQPGGDEKLGYFGALFCVAVAGSLVVLQTGQAIAHRLSVYFQTDLPRFVRLATRFIAMAGGIGAVVFVAALLYGRWFLTVVYRPEYAEHYPDFLVLVAAYCVILPVYVFGIAATHMRLFWIQVPIQLVVLTATCVAAALLIPDDPVGGAAWTALVRAVVQVVLYAICVVVGVARQRRRLAVGTVRNRADG